MWGRSSLSSMLVLLSRLEMYSSFNFTTYTDTMHQLCPKWLLARVAYAWNACLCIYTSFWIPQKGFCSFKLQHAYLLKHAISALQASLLLRYHREPCAQLCHLHR